MAIQFGNRPAGNRPAGSGLETIFAQSVTDESGTNSPLSGASDTLVLPFDPSIMDVMAGWDLLNGATVVAQGHSFGKYSRTGGSNVFCVFDGVNWVDFDNISNDESGPPQGTTLSVGVLTSSTAYAHAFTLEYTPSTHTLSFLAVNSPASSRIPRLRSLLILGSR